MIPSPFDPFAHPCPTDDGHYDGDRELLILAEQEEEEDPVFETGQGSARDQADFDRWKVESAGY